MERIKVESSKIDTIGYDGGKKLLEVAFKNGNIYRHKEVPANFWTELMLAPSIGKYYFNNIKESFPYNIYNQEI